MYKRTRLVRNPYKKDTRMGKYEKKCLERHEVQV